MSTQDQDFNRHVYSVQRYISLTAPRYERLCKPGLTTHPICCFGNPSGARIVTVGLNPSAEEFTANRKWPEELTHDQLAERCRNYFTNPYRWFAEWSAALKHLDDCYETGGAVHLDLSPRVTRYASEWQGVEQQKLFRDMVDRDLWTFFGTLQLCKNAKLVLMAGAVTKEFYINEYLQLNAADHGAVLAGKFNRGEQIGRGKTEFHELKIGPRVIPVFFCSSSPSDRKSPILAQRVKEHAGKLRQILKRTHS